MNVVVEPLHVVFGMSAAGSVGQALKQIGCAERVIGFMDDLSFGPINDATREQRERWIADQFGYDFEEVCFSADRFWSEVTSPAVSPVAWVCRNDAAEYAGYLEFVWRMGESPFHIIDTNDVSVPQWPVRKMGVWALSTLIPTEIAEARFIERQKPVSADERKEARDLWQRLRIENAPFRVFNPAGFVSAPITHFDDMIFTCVLPEWQKAARVVGDAMGVLMAAPFSQCPSDLVIWARVLALADMGRIEIDGLGTEMRDCRARLAQVP